MNRTIVLCERINSESACSFIRGALQNEFHCDVITLNPIDHTVKDIFKPPLCFIFFYENKSITPVTNLTKFYKKFVEPFDAAIPLIIFIGDHEQDFFISLSRQVHIITALGNGYNNLINKIREVCF